MDPTIDSGRRSDPPPPSPPPTATSKRRVRTISTLTQEQVRKKRDNDREAQRAFRERTKTRIHVLEDEVAALKAECRTLERSKAPELQALIEDNRALRSQIQRLTQLARPLVSLLTSDTDNAGDGVDHESLPSPAAHRPPGNSSATHAMTDGLADATNAWPSPSTQSNIQSAVKETEGTRPHPSPQSSSQYNAAMAQTSNFVREHQQQGWFQDRSNDHERHSTGNIGQDVDMGVETQAASQACTYPESLPQSVGFSPPGNDYLARDDRSLSSTTRRPQEHARYGAVTTDGSHDPRITYSNAFNTGQLVAHQRAYCTSSNASLVHASSPQNSIAPGYRDAESGSYPRYVTSSHNADVYLVADDYLDGVMTNISSLKPHAAPQGPTAPTNSTVPPFAWAQPEANEKITMSTILPKHMEATCPLDQILLDFLTSRRLLAAQGTPASVLVGPLKPSITGLVNPSFKSSAHAAIRVMADVVSTFKDTKLQEQLGFFYIMYSTMRWQIAPTDETFESLPLWLRPTVFQVVVPHAAWIDNIPWPRIRDLLIQNPTKYTFRDFSELYANNVNLNWPFDAADAVMPKTDGSDELVMNPLFEKHIRKLECWSVSEPFKERFPEFAAAIEDS
ncbi:hypothetical protein V502_10712 [Pseudogymnoascus sp. VKM F-4520 (FW-2644)]|nr:hypothetical protein V502_10712 [Pseudogymnoascus sp. VKM F-4520 (FW-2644)]